ncbi:hypothetical protein ACS0TY_021993 [Phlomoides rotata]
MNQNCSRFCCCVDEEDVVKFTDDVKVFDRMPQLLIFSFFISVTYAILLRSEIERLKGSFLKQLAIANESIGGGVIVVLAERDKEEMEMDIAKLEFDLMGSWVICRSGSPLILADLKKLQSTFDIKHPCCKSSQYSSKNSFRQFPWNSKKNSKFG